MTRNETSDKRLRIVFFGTPFFVVPVLEELIKNFTVVGIVTTPDVQIGRKKILTGTPVKLAFEKYLDQTDNKGLIINSVKLDDKTTQQLKELNPDIFIVAAYGHLIPKALLDIPKYGSLNIHPSLLPKYRGPSPIQTALLHGDDITGVTIIKMDEEIDHGPILLKKELPITHDDTFETLHVKLFTFASEMLSRAIPAYVSGKLQPMEQDHDSATYCDHIAREGGRITLENPPNKRILDQMIRAYYPWPTVWLMEKNKAGKEIRIKLLPGKRIQPEGSKPMSWKDFRNGYPKVGEKLEALLE